MSATKTTVLLTLVILLCAACFADHAFSQEKPKTTLAVPCVWHFNVFQYDEYQHETIGLTAKQLDWYQKKLEKEGKYPYVCYDPTVTSKSTGVANAVIFVITVSRSQHSGTQGAQRTRQVPVTGTVTDTSTGNVSTVEATETVTTTEAVPYTDTERPLLLDIYNPSEDGKPKKQQTVNALGQTVQFWPTFSRLQVRQRGGNGWAALGTNLRDRNPDHGLIEDAVKVLSTGK